MITLLFAQFVLTTPQIFSLLLIGATQLTCFSDLDQLSQEL